jgi:hypothetical protein
MSSAFYTTDVVRRRGPVPCAGVLAASLAAALRTALLTTLPAVYASLMPLGHPERADRRIITLEAP